MAFKPITGFITVLAFQIIFSGCFAMAAGQQAAGQQAAGQQAAGQPQPDAGPAVTRQTIISEHISLQDAYAMIKENAGSQDFLLIDVRTPKEFREKQIAGALNIDYYAQDYEEQLDKLDKTKKVLLYCRSGNRSGKTLPVMKALGFTEVYNMRGGIIQWEANKYPLLKS